MKNAATTNIIFNYFILTFMISWILWSPFYFSKSVNEFWILPGAWGPTIAAIALTFIQKGKKGVKVLLRKLLVWKVSFKYYLFALFIIAIVGIISVLIHKVLGGDFPDTEVVLNGMGLDDGQVGLAILLLPAFFLVNTLIGGPIAEELGWRGYAQSALQQKYSPNISGGIIGFLWALWHLPLIVFFPKAAGHLPIWVYFPLMTAMGIIFSWLYNCTKGSVLLAILLHGGMNFTLGFLGATIFTTPTIQFTLVVLIILLAIIVAIKNKKPAKSFPIESNIFLK